MPRQAADRDTRLIVGVVGVSALGDFLLWIPLTLRLQRVGDRRRRPARIYLEGDRGRPQLKQRPHEDRKGAPSLFT